MSAVRHTITQAEGTVASQTVLTAEIADDLAGPWSLVRFDDGLACWVPDSRLEGGLQFGDGHPRASIIPAMAARWATTSAE